MTPLGGPRVDRPRRPSRRDPGDRILGPEDRLALWGLLVLHVALEAGLVVAGWTLYKYLGNIQLTPWQKVMFQVGLAAAFVWFGVRGLALWRQLRRGGYSTKD
jgi:hypothetical protein